MDAESLIQWKDPIKSGIFMVVGLTGLISLSCLSLISVVAYACLALLCCTTATRLYQFLIGSSSKAGANTTPDPFCDWLNKDIVLPKEKITDRVSSSSSTLERYLLQLQRVILLKDYMGTVIFLGALYGLYILGGWFDLLTLVTLAFVLLLTLPKIYRLYQKQFDSIYAKLKKQMQDGYKKVQPTLKKIPGFNNLGK